MEEKSTNQTTVDNNFLHLMRENYISFKHNHKEWYIVLASIAIVLWFRGITGLLDVFLIHNNSIIGNIITILIAIIIFILDDFSLSEIFTPRDNTSVGNNNQYSRNAAVNASTSSFMTIG